MISYVEKKYGSKIFLAVVALTVSGVLPSLVYAGGWGYYISSGSVSGEGNYDGISSDNATIAVKVNLPVKMSGYNAWINNTCHEGQKINSLSVFNLKKSFDVVLNGKNYQLKLIKHNLSAPIGYTYDKDTFKSFWTNDNYYGAICGVNGRYENNFLNGFPGVNVFLYGNVEPLPVGSFSGRVNIGTLNAYREPTPQTNYELAMSLTNGVQLNIDYNITIRNSCKTTPSIININHGELPSIGVEGSKRQENISLTCDHPTSVKFSFSTGDTLLSKENGAMKTEIKDSAHGVSTILSLQNDKLKYDSSTDAYSLDVNNIETIKINSLLKRDGEIKPGLATMSTIVKLSFD